MSNKFQDATPDYVMFLLNASRMNRHNQPTKSNIRCSKFQLLIIDGCVKGKYCGHSNCSIAVLKCYPSSRDTAEPFHTSLLPFLFFGAAEELRP